MNHHVSSNEGNRNEEKKKTHNRNIMLTLVSSIMASTAIADVGPGVCDGERPQFEDPKYQLFGGDQILVGAQWRVDDSQGVLTVYDLTGQSSAPLDTDWPVLTYSHQDWVRSQMGSLFGVALDDRGNIYTSHTAIYFTDTVGAIGDQPGQIYKADAITGNPTVFATLPNNSDPLIAASAFGISESYPGLGNLCFDVEKQMVYVTNFEDGRIYRIDATGTCLSTWDHATGIVNDCSPEAGDGEGAAPLGERVWGVQSFNGRVYYSVWVEDAGAIDLVNANQIWSVQYDALGEFIAGTEQLEITMPIIFSDHSNPVADIAFSQAGKMMLAERSMITDVDTPRFNSGAHRSRALEYMCDEDGRWIPSASTFGSGSGSGTNCAGGCDYSYATTPDDRVWVTGDALHLTTPDNLYGFQGLPQAGGTVTNSILIDMDADVIQQDKYGIGSVEISCPGQIQAPCATVSNEELLCDLDGSGNYTLTFDLTNNSGQDVQYLLVLPEAGYNIVPSGLISLPSLLLDGDTTQVTLTFNGGFPGDQLCFTLSLNTSDFEECCAIEQCITVPDCDCAQIHDESIECLSDGSGCFIYTFDVDNLTTETIFYSYFVPTSPAGVTIDTGFADPSRWDFPPMVSFGTETVSIIICGAMPGEEVCFLMTLHTEGLDECCSFEVCLTAPECDPAGECPADCNNDGLLNFFDLSIFLSEFTNQDTRADMNNDNLWNFFDISAFLTAFAAGCP